MRVRSFRISLWRPTVWATLVRLPREDVGPSALVLHLCWIGLPLEDLLNDKLRTFQIPADSQWLEEEEIQRWTGHTTRLHEAFRYQYEMQAAKGHPVSRPYTFPETLKAARSLEYSRWHREPRCLRASLLEGREPSCFLRGNRYRDSIVELQLTSWARDRGQNRCARISKIAGNVTRTTAHVTRFVAPGNLGGKAIEQFSIKGFVLKFGENSARILVREVIVAFTNQVNGVIVHCGCDRCRQQRELSLGH
jgi:hypothetical protein